MGREQLLYPVLLSFGPNFGVQTNRFGFTISWATNTYMLVETATNLSNPNWIPLATNILTEGWSYFSDPEWTNRHARFYRISSP